MITGILLAAGAATRFGGGKLLQALPGGIPLCVASVRNLKAGVDRVVAVVRLGDQCVFEALSNEPDVSVVICDKAHEGMGASLVCGVSASHDSDGWLIALADMPSIQPTTIRAIADQIRSGAKVCVPLHDGKRGHPVGFSEVLRDELTSLSGDTGAKSVIAQHSRDVQLLATDDAGILIDIDTHADLAKLSS